MGQKLLFFRHFFIHAAGKIKTRFPEKIKTGYTPVISSFQRSEIFCSRLESKQKNLLRRSPFFSMLQKRKNQHKNYRKKHFEHLRKTLCAYILIKLPRLIIFSGTNHDRKRQKNPFRAPPDSTETGSGRRGCRMVLPFL